MQAITQTKILVVSLLIGVLLPALCLAGYVPGEVIVRFQPGALRLSNSRGPIPLGHAIFGNDALREGLAVAEVTDFVRLGSTWGEVPTGVGLMDFSDIYVLKVPEATDIRGLVEALKSLPEIADAEPNYICTLHWEPNDSLFYRSWHLENTGVFGALPDVDMDLSAAWDIVRGTSIPAYVLDTGMKSHADLSSFGGVDCTGGDCGPGEYIDTYGHGTAVIAIIAATCDNNSASGPTGLTGVNCYSGGNRIHVVKCGDAGVPISNGINGLEYVASRNGRIANCSWGTCDELSFSLAAAVRQAYLSGPHGAFVVCSSGNHEAGCKDSWPRYPAALKTAFAVSAINKAGENPDISIGGSYVDVCAPGGSYEIVTAYFIGSYKYDFGGTSASAPMVAGVAGLLLGADTSLVNDDLAYIIKRTAVDYEPWGWDAEAGWGIVNAHRAVRFISGPNRTFCHGVLSQNDVSISDSSALYQKIFKNLRWCFDDPTLPDAATAYLVKRYRIEGDASLSSPYLDDPRNIWVRHKNGLCPGWPDETLLDCVLEVGWGAVDTTGWSQSSITLYTYTYALFETSDTSFVGYYPIHPDDIEIPYSVVLGPFDEVPYAEVTSPNGGENWGCGSPTNRNITWIASDDDGIDSVTIYWSVGLQENGVRAWPFVLTSGEENDSTWSWAIGSEDTCSSECRVAIVAHDGRLDRNFDISDGDFQGGGPQQHQVPPMRPRIPRARPECFAETDATIWFNVAEVVPVTIKIYDVTGRTVRCLLKEKALRGTHRIQWDLTDSNGIRVSEGLYFYVFTAGEHQSVGKIVVLR